MIKFFKFIGMLMAVLVGLLILLVAVINLIPGDTYKKIISSSVTSATGRNLVIDGDVDVSLLADAEISVTGVQFANADWGSRSQMATSGNLKIKIPLLPLVRGILDVTLLIDAPDLLLETSKSGRGNWQFASMAEEIAKKAAEAAERARLPEESIEKKGIGGFPLRLRFRQVAIKGTKFHFIDSLGKEQVALENVQLIMQPDEDNRLSLDFSGIYNDLPLRLSGYFDNADFLVDNLSTPVNLTGLLGAVKLEVEGTVGPLASSFDHDVTLSIQSQTLASFSELAGQDAPDIGPIQLSARLIGADNIFKLSDLSATLDDRRMKIGMKGAVDDLTALHGLELTADIRTTHLTELLAEMGLSAETALPDMFQANLSLEGDLEKMILTRFNAGLHGRGVDVSVKGRAADIMKLAGVEADLTAAVDSLDAVARMAQVELPSIGGIEAKINISSEDQPFAPLNIKVDANSDRVHLDLVAAVEDPAKMDGADADVNVSADSLDWLAQWLELELPPLGKLKASASILYEDKELELTDIKANLDGGAARIQVIGRAGDILKLQGIEASVELEAGSLDFVSMYTDLDLPSLGPLKASAVLTSRGEVFSARDIRVDLAGESMRAGVQGKVTDLVALQGIDVGLDFTVDSLAALSGVAGQELPSVGPLQGTAAVISSGQTFQLKQLSIDLEDEKIKANVSAAVADLLTLTGINADVDVAVDSLASLDQLAGRELPDTDPLSLKMNISSKGGIKDPAQIDARLSSDMVSARLKGSVAEPMAGRGIDMRFDLAADSWQELGKLAGAEIPAPRSVKMGARILAGDNRYAIEDLQIHDGKLDIVGKALFQWPVSEEGRPELTAEFKVSDLDLRKIQKAKAAHEDTAADNDTMDQDKADTDEEKIAGEKLFSAEPLPWETLRKVDADISLSVDRFQTLRYKLEDMQTRVTLDRGLLRVEPITARVGEGTFEGSIILDGRTSPGALAVDMKLDDGTFRDFGGRVDFLVDQVGTGDSVAELMAGLNGQIMLNIKGATLKRSLMTGFGTGLLSSLNPFTEHSETTEIICAVALFDIGDGIADADNTLAIQMPDVTWFGSGEVNLATEEIDFGMQPKARKGIMSVGSLAGLAHIGGTLAHPKVELDPADAAIKYGKYTAAVATGGLTFLAELAFSRVKANQDVCGAIVETFDELQQENFSLKTRRTKSEQGNSFEPPSPETGSPDRTRQKERKKMFFDSDEQYL